MTDLRPTLLVILTYAVASAASPAAGDEARDKAVADAPWGAHAPLVGYEPVPSSTCPWPWGPSEIERSLGASCACRHVPTPEMLGVTDLLFDEDPLFLVDPTDPAPAFVAGAHLPTFQGIGCEETSPAGAPPNAPSGFTAPAKTATASLSGSPTALAKTLDSDSPAAGVPTPLLFSLLIGAPLLLVAGWLVLRRTRD